MWTNEKKQADAVKKSNNEKCTCDTEKMNREVEVELNNYK